MKPKKQCNHSRCRTLIDYDQKYCKEHKGSEHKVYNLTRNKSIVSFYKSSDWIKLRHQAMIRDGWICQRCLNKGIITSANIGDHIIPVRQDWSRRLDIDNIMCLCSSCHNAKTAEEHKA